VSAGVGAGATSSRWTRTGRGAGRTPATTGTAPVGVSSMGRSVTVSAEMGNSIRDPHPRAARLRGRMIAPSQRAARPRRRADSNGRSTVNPSCRCVGLAVLALTLSACSEDEDVARSLDPTVCVPEATESRWAPSEASYSVTASFGSDLEASPGLVDVWGLAASPTGVLVYDAGATRVLEFDAELEPTAEYGRRGSGPGEFRYQRMGHGDWLAATDSSFFVLEYRGISEFRIGGDFKRFVSQSFVNVETVDAIAPFNSGLLFGSDRIDRGTGARSLQFWVVPLDGKGGPEVWRTETLPTLPGSRGRYVRGDFAGQGEPLWAATDSCLFVSDGSSPWLLRVGPGVPPPADTVPLRALQPPEPTREDERELARRRTMAAGVGINVGHEGLKPTAPARWSSMAVDPDGFLWIELWHPVASRDDPRRVLVVNPATGESREIVVPRFPDVFLDDGSFVSRTFDPELRVQVLVKYSPDALPATGGE